MQGLFQCRILFVLINVAEPEMASNAVSTAFYRSQYKEKLLVFTFYNNLNMK